MRFVLTSVDSFAIADRLKKSKMKILALLFLIGCASASFYDALDNAADEVVRDFMSGMEKAPPLRLFLDMDHDEIDQIEDDVKTELAKQLREHLNSLLDKVKDAMEHGGKMKEEFLEKLSEVGKKLKDMKMDLGEKAKAKIQELKDKFKDALSSFFEKFKDVFGLNKRATDEMEVALEDFNLKSFMEKLREMIKERLNVDKIKEKIRELLDKSELLQRFMDILKKHGLEKLGELIDKFFDKKEVSTRSVVKEYWEKLKEHFKNLKIVVEEKYLKFLEWAKETVKKGIDHSKTKIENIKAIAREFIAHIKEVKKDVALEALEFFRPYRDDMVDIFEEMKEKVKELMKKEE